MKEWSSCAGRRTLPPHTDCFYNGAPASNQLIHSSVRHIALFYDNCWCPSTHPSISHHRSSWIQGRGAAAANPSCLRVKTLTSSLSQAHIRTINPVTFTLKPTARLDSLLRLMFMSYECLREPGAPVDNAGRTNPHRRSPGGQEATVSTDWTSKVTPHQHCGTKIIPTHTGKILHWKHYCLFGT